jgi:hypothetical protein
MNGGVPMQTHFNFRLPRGYTDPSGTVHQEGIMRLATAIDEISSVQDPRVQANDAYLPVVLMSRVITRLGELPAIYPGVIENLFAADLAYLEDLYLLINNHQQVVLDVTCPQCSNQFGVKVSPLGVNDGNESG